MLSPSRILFAAIVTPLVLLAVGEWRGALAFVGMTAFVLLILRWRH